MEKRQPCKLPPLFAGNDGAILQWKMRDIAHGRMHVVTDMLSEYGLHYTQPRILGMILHRDGATQKELAAELNTSAAAMSATLRRLQKAGLVEKLPDTSDFRSNKIRLTEQGRRIHDDTFDKTLEIDRRMLEGFSAEETALLFRYLDRVQHNIDTMRGGETDL